jgi:hypothetical protein
MAAMLVCMHWLGHMRLKPDAVDAKARIHIAHFHQ